MVKDTLNILVDLDSILDTRLSILTNLNPDLAATMVNDMSYQSRVMDDFKEIPYTMFRAFYMNRDKRVLKDSTPTHIIELIQDYVNEAIVSSKKRNSFDGITVYVNCYPYNLTSVEIDNLSKALEYMIPNAAIKLISLTKDELTPKWVDENIAMLILYNGLSWLEHHNSLGNIVKHPLVEVALLTPPLVTNKHNITNYSKNLDDLEEMFKPLIRLTFTPVISFCTAITKKSK